MEPSSKAFGFGLVGSYTAIYATFVLGRHLSSASTPYQSINQILLKNFVLSVGHVKSGRWHVLLAYMFCHSTLWHLIGNSLATLIGIRLCSPFLNLWEVAAVYFGGGILGGVASIWLSRCLLVARYRSRSVGSSEGLFAVYSFHWLAESQRSKLSQLGWSDMLFAAIIAGEVCGVGIYLRHGFKGKGIWSLKQNHVILLAGAVTGFSAYAVSEVARKASERSQAVLTFAREYSSKMLTKEQS